MKLNIKAIALASIIMGANVCISAKNAPAAQPSPTVDTIALHNPDMKVFLPANPSGRAVVICPGGAYIGLAIDHEGYDWVRFFNERGIAVGVLAYRLPEGDRTRSITDAERAIETMRDSSAVWHIDPGNVGIMGSSAGGHLAAVVSTLSTGKAKPDFQILLYPLISLLPPHNTPIKIAHDSFLGADSSTSLKEEYSCQFQVTDKTPRAFIALSDDDTIVPPSHGTEYYMALHKAGVPASLHVYSNGGHGWGFNPFDHHDEMVAHLSRWLSRF